MTRNELSKLKRRSTNFSASTGQLTDTHQGYTYTSSPKKTRLAKNLFVLTMVIVFILCAIMITSVAYNPADFIRNQLVRKVKSSIGRNITITGQPYLTLYPSVSVVLPNISISPPPGMENTPTLSAERLKVVVALFPLLRNQISIKELNIDNPILNLHIDHKGKRSWQVQKKAESTNFELRLPSESTVSITRDNIPLEKASLASFFQNQIQLTSNKFHDIELSNIRINNGYIHYRDDRSGVIEAISAINATVTSHSSTDPILIDGNLKWNGESVALKLRLKAPNDFVQGQSGDIQLSMNSKPASVSFNGQMLLGDHVKITGSLLYSISSIQNFMYWVGTDLPNGDNLGSATLKSNLVATPQEITLKKANFRTKQIRSRGDFVIDISSARPKIKSDLVITKLDIDELALSFKGARPIKRSYDNNGKKTNLEQPPKNSLEAHLKNPSLKRNKSNLPYKNSSITEKVWNKKALNKKISFFDAAIQGKILNLDVSGLTIDKALVRLISDNETMQINMDRVELYDGFGRGAITASTSNAGLKIGANFDLFEITAQKLLKDVSNIRAINGMGRLTANLRGQGHSQDDIVSSLFGTASFIIKDGSIVGWDIPKILSDLQSGKLRDINQSQTAKTSFSEFASNFNFNRGIANTQSLRVLSPHIRITGSGNIDLGKRQIDKILRAKLLASLENQSSINLPGIEIPLRITGPWNNPDVEVDLAAILINEELVRDTIDTVRKLTDKISKKTTGEIIRGIIGDGKENVPSRLLEELFKN
ncbi:MAG: hypothetical protein TECD_01192 [Hyphomicrobiaceae bacterium hypho_1]